MFVNCTFSLVDLHEFGLIHLNPPGIEGNQEDPALLISSVPKPKVDADQAKLVEFCIQTDSSSVKGASAAARCTNRGLSKSDPGPAVTSERLLLREDPPLLAFCGESDFSLAGEKRGRVLNEVISPKGR